MGRIKQFIIFMIDMATATMMLVIILFALFVSFGLDWILTKIKK